MNDPRHSSPLDTRPTVSVFADGAPGPMTSPLGTLSGVRTPEQPDNPALPPLIVRAEQLASRVRRIEGPRGLALRTQVWLRHVGYLFVIAGCVGVSHWAFRAIPAWRHGGYMLLYSTASILLIAVIGSVLYGEARHEIQKSARHYAFGIVALPGAALAVFMRVVSQALASAGGDDMFVEILRGNGLPLMYVTLVVIPVFVYAKYIFGGIRTTNRSGMLDEEFMSTYMRQDGAQR